MTQAETPAPVIVHLRRVKIGLTGLALGLFGVLMLLLAVLDLAGGGVSFATKLFGAAGLVMTLGCVFMLGLSWRAPVALRMDVHGISGFYTAPASWDEIAEVGVQAMPKGHTALGFRLVDPVGFRDRQTAWQRFIFWLNGASGGYHLSIASNFIKDTTPEALLAKAEALRAVAAQNASRAPEGSGVI